MPEDIVKILREQNGGKGAHVAAEEIERLRALIPLAREVLGIADSGILPDGDGPNIPTLLWAESWKQRLEEAPCLKTL